MTLPSAPDVEGLRELLAKATSLPWHATTSRKSPPIIDEEEWIRAPDMGGAEGDIVWTVSPSPDYEGWNTDSGYPGYGLSDANAALIVAAVNALPALLDAHARLTTQVEAMRLALEPFAALGRLIDSAYGPRTAPDDGVFQSGAAWRQADGSSRTLTWGDFRAARRALESQSK